MRIIDRVTDYYDFAGGGFDDSIVYDRRNLSHAWFPDHLSLPEVLDVGWEFSSSKIRLLPFWAMVGGYGIPGIVFGVRHHHGIEEEFLLDADAVETRCRAEISAHVRDASRFMMREVDASLISFREHIEGGRTDLTEFCLDHSIVTGMIVREPFRGYSVKTRTGGGSEYRPARLLEIGLDTVLPAHEAHMLVSRFIGGVMTENPGGVEISDRSRIVKAGFDLRSSFRKSPEKA